MYWALALGDEPMCFQPPQKAVQLAPGYECTTISPDGVGTGNGTR
jgi:hypothetical protein